MHMGMRKTLAYLVSAAFTAGALHAAEITKRPLEHWEKMTVAQAIFPLLEPEFESGTRAFLIDSTAPAIPGLLFLDDTIMGHFTDDAPQLIVIGGYHPSADISVGGGNDCAYAILEPGLDVPAQRLQFSAEHRNSFWEDSADPLLCGTIDGISTNEEKLHDAQLRRYVVDKRKDPKNPEQYQERYRLTFTGSSPALVGKIEREMKSFDPNAVPVYLEYSGADHVRIVRNTGPVAREEKNKEFCETQQIDIMGLTSKYRDTQTKQWGVQMEDSGYVPWEGSMHFHFTISNDALLMPFYNDLRAQAGSDKQVTIEKLLKLTNGKTDLEISIK